MEPVAEPLRMYGEVAAYAPLAWEWVAARLDAAEMLWVVAPSTGLPHPRPVWGVWFDDAVHLSLGSPTLRRALTPGTPVAVHLDDAHEVVIVEGEVRGPCFEPAVIAAYDAKYSWSYDLEQYGPFTTIDPATVLAWRTAGPAGRDGFAEVARFSF